MSTAPICSEAEVADLVHRFYAAVRQDPLLAPIFAAHVHDWDQHLGRMVAFWCSTLLGSGDYRGTPMARHAVLPDLSPELFRHWLTLFHATTAALANAGLRERADLLAARIAQSLWYGYQLYRSPERDAHALEHAASPGNTPGGGARA